MLVDQCASFAGFVDFIKAQPVDRPVDHSNGWEDCALGDYATSINMHYMDVVQVIVRDLGFVHNHELFSMASYKNTESDPPRHRAVKLMQHLNESWYFGDTYGDLRRVLDEIGL